MSWSPAKTCHMPSCGTLHNNVCPRVWTRGTHPEIGKPLLSGQWKSTVKTRPGKSFHILTILLLFWTQFHEISLCTHVYQRDTSWWVCPFKIQNAWLLWLRISSPRLDGADVWLGWVGGRGGSSEGDQKFDSWSLVIPGSCWTAHLPLLEDCIMLSSAIQTHDKVKSNISWPTECAAVFLAVSQRSE